MEKLASNGMWKPMDPFLVGDTHFNGFNYISALVSAFPNITLETEKLTASVPPNPLAQNQASLPNIEARPRLVLSGFQLF